MARDYARIMTAIWRNKEFRALDESPQRAYILLVTQPDISAAGVLPLRLRRWADMSADSSVDSLTRALKVLEAGRFIVVDWDVEELLVRSFIRWDGGFNNPKRKPVILRESTEVESQRIAGHLAAELARVGITPPDRPPDGPSGSATPDPDSHADSLSDSHADSLSKINRHEAAQNPFPQVDSLSDRHAAEDGVVVTLSTSGTSTHNPEKTPTPTESGEAEAITARTLVGEWIDLCRKRPPAAVIGHTSKAIKTMLDEGIDPDDIRTGIQQWSAKGLHPSALPSVVNEFMNARPTHLALASGQGTVRPSTTDARVNAALALAAKYEQEENQ
jgi:hypothetical protein